MGPPSAIGAASGEPDFEIWLPGHPPGANKLTRLNRWQTGVERAKWKEMAYIAAREKQGRNRRTFPAPVVLLFHPVYERQRRRDIDNLIAGYKPIIDGLVLAKVIADDDVTTVTGIWVQPRVTKEHPPGVLVRVYSTGNTP